MAAREEEVTFDRITRVYRDESQRKTLTPLESDFWEKVARYIASLEHDLAAERAKDPNSKATLLLQDELQKVRLKREQIYQFRERKIGLLATVHASEGSEEVRGLTRHEAELLERLVALFHEGRSGALEPAGAAGTTVPEPRPEPAKAAPAKSAPPPATGRDGEEGEVLLRVLEDVPPFQGPDGTYRLRKEDLVTLPPHIAKVLVDRGKARPVRAPEASEASGLEATVK